MTLDNKTEKRVLWIKTTWTIVEHIMTIAIVLAMFHLAKSPFETVVVAGLTLIFSELVVSVKSLGASMRGHRLATQQEFLLLARIAFPKSANADDITPFEKDYEESWDAHFIKTDWRMYIHLVSLWLIFAIAVWNIVVVVI